MSYSFGKGIVTDGLVFYVDAANENSYLGSGTTWTDLAGSDDGTLTNGPTFDSGNGGSIAFDGTNDYTDFGNTLPIDGTSAGTVSIWAKTSASTSLLFTKYDTSGSNSTAFYIAVVSGAARMFSGTQSNYRYYTTTATPIGSNNWANIVFTYDNFSTDLKCYIDGAAYSTGQISNGTAPTSIVPQVSGINWKTTSITTGSGTNYYQADIANVSAHNRALSATEILQNYNALKNRFV
jgi:hypothetical protein